MCTAVHCTVLDCPVLGTTLQCVHSTTLHSVGQCSVGQCTALQQHTAVQCTVHWSAGNLAWRNVIQAYRTQLEHTQARWNFILF